MSNDRARESAIEASASSTSGLSVSLEDFAAFGPSSNSSDVASLGFPAGDLMLASLDTALGRCATLGAGAGACVKSVKRHLS